MSEGKKLCVTNSHAQCTSFPTKSKTPINFLKFQRVNNLQRSGSRPYRGQQIPDQTRWKRHFPHAMQSAPLAHYPYQQDAFLRGGGSSAVRNARRLRKTHRKGRQSLHRTTTLLNQVQGTTCQNRCGSTQKKQT